jgi:hypothetical protein
MRMRRRMKADTEKEIEINVQAAISKQGSILWTYEKICSL